jgi:hypothetical protein
VTGEGQGQSKINIQKTESTPPNPLLNRVETPSANSLKSSEPKIISPEPTLPPESTISYRLSEDGQTVESVETFRDPLLNVKIKPIAGANSDLGKKLLGLGEAKPHKE